MSLIKKLAGETVLYGLSSIIGRLLNYLLVPLHTRLFTQSDYGIVSHLFALSGFLIVVYSYRMESAFFRFGTPKEDREDAFDTGLSSLIISTLCLTVVLFLLASPIAAVLDYPDQAYYVRWFALILAFDCLCELPFARLRLEQRPIRFVSIKIINIGVNIALNLFWLLLCPWAVKQGYTAVHWVWRPDWGVEYVFLANLMASGITLLLLSGQLRTLHFGIDKALWIKMIKYAAPLIIVGLAGIMDEMFSRAMMTKLLPGTLAENRAQLGIFSANYKLAMLITMFTQAYRYAAEPFFFRHAGDRDAMKIQADAAKWFTIAAATGMLGILLFLDALKAIFLGERFHSGLGVVPVLLMANVFLGLYYNFSVWYRLKDRTGLGAIISVLGALLTIGLNVWWIPLYGYVGAAWVTLICYAFMSVATWYTGLKHYPVPYPLGRMAMYVFGALGIYLIVNALQQHIAHSPVLLWGMRGAFFGAFLLGVYGVERKG